MVKEFSFHSHTLHTLTCLFYLSLSLTLFAVTASHCNMFVTPSNPLVSFLERLQQTAFQTFANNSNFDPKTYVDLPLKFTLSVTEDAFRKLPRNANGSVSVEDLKSFLEVHFEGAGDDLVYLEPEDFVPEPEGFLPKVKHPQVRAWALEVHSLWKNLSRKISGAVKAHPSLHTLLPLPASVVIPGSRFREVYYWDSYWVIRGLLDKASASKFSSVLEKELFYLELASAAESGWDFSTRWMRNPPDFTTLAATSVIPVDLNAFLLGMELNIAFFAKVTGDNSTAEHFLEISDLRKKAMNSVFWNANMKQWLDYWLSNSTCEEVHVWKNLNQNQSVFASNFVPLWMKPFYSDTSLVASAVESLKTSGLLRAAGVATSLTDSGQQWDFPNGWAPLQHMLVEGMLKSELKEARSLAEEIAIRWITTNYIVYKKTGVMHEKYDVEHCGEFGGGGEYVPQTGFGWSNGVVLAFLEEFGWPQDRDIEC